MPSQKIKALEESDRVINLTRFKGHKIYYIFFRVKGVDWIPHLSKYQPTFDLRKYVKPGPYKLFLRAKTDKGDYSTYTYNKFGEDYDSSADDELFEEYRELQEYHRGQEIKHSAARKKAKEELRDLAKTEHEQARKKHFQALNSYALAIQQSDNTEGTKNYLAELTAKAKEESLDGWEADDKYQKEFPKREWFKEKGFWKLLADSWDSSNRHTPSLTIVGNFLEVEFSNCNKRVRKLEYRTENSGGWQPFKVLAQWAGMLGRSWCKKIEFRANKDNSTISRFTIPKFPIEFNEQKELEEAIKLLKGNHVKKGIDTLEGIQEKRREKKANEEEIRMAIEKNHLFIGQENHWKALKLALGPTKNWGTMNPRGSKNRYKIVPKHILETLIKMSGVSSKKYIHDLFVCKEFCIALMSYLAEWGINCFTWVRSDDKEDGSQHEWLILHYINDEGIVEAWHLEPQRGKWIEKAKWFQGVFIIKDSYMVS